MNELLTTTKAMFEESPRIFNSSVEAGQYLDKPDQRQHFCYDSILFVCHSLGALLLRRMIAEAHATNEPWADKIDSILLAPAHRGGRPLRLALESPIPILGAAINLHQYHFPVLQDLVPNSVFVSDTSRRTTEAIAANNNAKNRTSLICDRVAHADSDRVVDIQAPFCADPLPFEIIYGHTHTSICKVDQTQNDALMYLLKVLQ